MFGIKNRTLESILAPASKLVDELDEFITGSDLKISENMTAISALREDNERVLKEKDKASAIHGKVKALLS